MRLSTSKSPRFVHLLKSLLGVLILLLFAFSKTASAQQRYTISGYLRDATSGEALMFANIYPEGLKIGVTTNEYGFFSLTLPEGKYNIVFSYIGFQTVKNEIILDKDLYQNISLSPHETKIKEITVVSRPRPISYAKMISERSGSM